MEGVPVALAALVVSAPPGRGLLAGDGEERVASTGLERDARDEVDGAVDRELREARAVGGADEVEDHRDAALGLFFSDRDRAMCGHERMHAHARGRAPGGREK